MEVRSLRTMHSSSSCKLLVDTLDFFASGADKYSPVAETAWSCRVGVSKVSTAATPWRFFLALDKCYSALCGASVSVESLACTAAAAVQSPTVFMHQNGGTEGVDHDHRRLSGDRGV